MSRKRKTEATRLDELDRTMYSTFCSAANSLSQLYTQTMNQQKASFQAGERHALEKLYQWMMRKHEEGLRITVADIVAHLQNEMDCVVDDSIGSRSCQTTMQMSNSGIQHLSALFGQPTAGLAPRSAHSDQSKNSVFSNALSSPVRRSLHPFHLDHGGGFYTNGGGLPTANTESRNHDPCQNREVNSLGSNYSSMDIHTDSPPRGSY